MSADIQKRLADPNLIALRCGGDDWPHGFLSQTPIPNAWVGLVITAGGRRRFVPSGENPHPDATDTLVLVRNRDITIPLHTEEAPAADKHLVNASAEIVFRWNTRDDDLAALRATLLSQPELTADRLAAAIDQAAGTAALRTFVRGLPAETLVQEDQRAALLEHLRTVLQRFLFSAGAVLERIGKLDFTSRSLKHEQALARETTRRVEQLKARQTVELAALAATKRRLADLSDVFDKLKAAAGGDETLRWHELLPSLTPGERGRLLENLWRITPDRTSACAIAVVTSDECLWLDPADPQCITRQSPLPKDIGGIRSVAFAPTKRWLLIGAATGVWAIDADTGEVCHQYAVPDAPPTRMGFNAATLCGDHVFATHSKLGCWSWPVDHPDDAHEILIPGDDGPSRVRAVTTASGDRVLFAADDEVRAYDAQSDSLTSLGEATARIRSLATSDNLLFVATEDARVYRVDLGQPEDWYRVPTPSIQAETLVARRWSDLVELIVPAGDLGVIAIYEEQQVRATLLDSRTPIRRVWACDDLVVGLNEFRDRLVVMNANLPERTGREARIAQKTGELISDACIVTTHAAPEPQSHG